jgi:hypothetical protein
MRESFVAAQGAQERLLERVLSLGAPDPPNEEAEDLGPMLLVQALEGRNTHNYREKCESVTRRTFRGAAAWLPICMSEEM